MKYETCGKCWACETRPFGKCAICGDEDYLSFEHVPPRAAFNHNRFLRSMTPVQIIAGHPGQVSCRGAGAFTLCESCNNKTGGTYGDGFKNWAIQTATKFDKLGRLTLPIGTHISCSFHDIQPLKVIKQIICMFFSVNAGDSRFRDNHAELVGFLRNHRRQYLPYDAKVFCYLATGKSVRTAAQSSQIKIDESNLLESVQEGIARTNDAIGRSSLPSEIAFPPLGYVLVFGDVPNVINKYGMPDISHFAKHTFREQVSMEISMPILPVCSWFPLDYRTRHQLDDCARENMRYLF